MKTPILSLLVVASVVLTGCTFPKSGASVPRSQVGVLQNVDLGHVTQVRLVIIDGERTILGLWGGAAVGAGATYPTGRVTTGKALGNAAGAAAGMVIGQAVEEAATRKKGQELTIQLDNGSTVTVVQEAEDGLFREGDRVQVNHGGWGDATVRLAM